VLNDRQAAELTRLGEQIEALYGVPMDVEWAMPGTEADAHFAILQARPITVLPPAPAEPLDWPLPKLGGKYARASIIELHSLPPAIRQRLSAMSPINYVSEIRAPLIVLLHDRDDPVIPASESRCLRDALAAHGGVHYTEFTVFKHLAEASPWRQGRAVLPTAGPRTPAASDGLTSIRSQAGAVRDNRRACSAPRAATPRA